MNGHNSDTDVEMYNFDDIVHNADNVIFLNRVAVLGFECKCHLMQRLVNFIKHLLTLNVLLKLNLHIFLFIWKIGLYTDYVQYNDIYFLRTLIFFIPVCNNTNPARFSLFGFLHFLSIEISI